MKRCTASSSLCPESKRKKDNNNMLTENFNAKVKSARSANMKKTNRTEPKNQKEYSSCFICGNSDLASTSLAKKIYSKQLGEFNYILEKLHPGAAKEEIMDSCKMCLGSITQVWDLHQEMVSIVEKCFEIMKARLDKDCLSPTKSAPSKKVNNADKVNKLEHHTFPESSSPEAIKHETNPEDYLVDSVEWKGEVTNEISDNYNEDKQLKESESGQVSTCPTTRPIRKSKINAKAVIRSVTRTISPDKKIAQDKLEESDYELDRDDAYLKSEEEGTSDFEITPTKKCTQRGSTSTSKKQLACQTCGKMFSTSATLRNHNLRVHDQTMHHDCDSCAKKFFTITELQAHKKSIHDPDSFCCSVCGKKLSSRRNLAIHETIVCNVIWDKKELAGLKLKIQHCTFGGCAKKFAKDVEFRRHAKTHTNTKNFTCSTCGKAFKLQLSLDLHSKLICGSDESIATKIRSRRSFNAKKPKNLKCPFCPRRFITERMLRYHQEEKNHKSAEDVIAICDLCGVTVTSAGLPGHIRRVHEKAFSCFCPVAECEKGFYSTSEMIQHERYVHSGQPRPKPIKNLKCSLCPNTYFAHPSTLATHKARIHLTAKPKYPCDQCDFSFYAKPELVRHLKTHNKPGLNCPDCGKHFEYEFRLKTHQKRELCWKRSRRGNSQASKTRKKPNGWCAKCDKVVASNKWLLARHLRELHPEDVKVEIVEDGEEGGTKSEATGNLDNTNISKAMEFLFVQGEIEISSSNGLANETVIVVNQK